jgi:glycosyltransferase involved in cell wall biosynthesis
MGTAIERAAVDLFHAPHYVVPFTRARTVVTIHDRIHLHMRHRNPLAPLYARAMLRRAVNKAARVMTVSDAVRREIEDVFPGTQVTVTPNGVDPIFRAGAPQTTAARSFLFVGNDKPHKNAGRAVEALTLVRRRHPDATLVLAGAPFERYHAAEGVISAGFVKTEELASLYRNAIALVQPSVVYQSADDRLAKLSAGQKLLIRMGVDNATVIKGKLREIQAELL